MANVVRCFVGVAVLLAWQNAVPGVVNRSGSSENPAGIAVDCSNPHRNLGVVRAPRSTMVFQTSPHGMEWRHSLPEMEFTSDRYFMAPDGSGVVVGVSPASSFLVAGELGVREVDGAVLAVDYQGDRVLVVTSTGGDPGSGEMEVDVISGLRARVFDMRSGALVGDSRFNDAIPVMGSEFIARLSEDGSFYYYVERDAAGKERPVLRDVQSGKKELLDVEVPGSVEDMMMYSRTLGYVIADERIYSIGRGQVVPVADNQAVGGVYRLIESSDPSIQAVKGREGWGVFDAGTGEWILTGVGSSISFSGPRLVVVDTSVDSRGIRVWDFSGVEPKLLVDSRPGRALNEKSLVCASPFGFMTFEHGQLQWHRAL
jgi:hypothetical protein